MAADFKSVQLTNIDAGTHQGAGAYKVGSPHRPIFLGTLAFASAVMAKSKTAAMVRLPIGVIPFQVGILISESLGSSKISIGKSGAATKYRLVATETGILGWNWFMLEAAWDDAPLTAEEEVWITNDGSADFPTTSGGAIDMAFECLVP